MIFTRACAILCLALLLPPCMSARAFADDAPATESSSPPAIPKFKLRIGNDTYPDQAKRMNAQGRILLGFEIDNRGRAMQINIESAEANKILSDSAVSVLKAMKFELPAVPGSTATSQQYRLSVVFEMTPCGRLHHFDVPKDAQILFCGTPLRRL
jgi:TonB family protein